MKNQDMNNRLQQRIIKLSKKINYKYIIIHQNDCYKQNHHVVWYKQTHVVEGKTYYKMYPTYNIRWWWLSIFLFRILYL